jgi:glycosyltransferase involved in cell wall biosynthesis
VRVCIDGFNIALRQGSGIATYARGLNLALRAMGFQTHILYGPAEAPGRHNLLNEISLLDANPPGTSGLKRLTAGLAALAMPWTTLARRIERTGEVIHQQLEANAPPCDALWARRDVFHAANYAYAAVGRFSTVRLGRNPGADVMHWTCPLPIREPRIANVYTIHDLVPLRLPFATLDVKRRFYSMCRQICRGADRIVTVSEHSKEDIMRVFGVAERRIAVTYQAVDLPKAWLTQPDTVVAQDIERVFELSWRGYFLFYGAIEPKKNLGRVIEAYLASGVVAPLVIVGHDGWLNDDDFRLLRGDAVDGSPPRRGINHNAGRIRRYDYLPSRLLASLVRGAKATLMPSLYEGFGLPVLESILLGTPVLASTAGALPEVAGDGALLVDPYDTDAIRTAIRDLDADEDLRASLVARGARQARRFSGEAYRGRLTDLYAAVA